MTKEIQGSVILGVGYETTYKTLAAPTFYIPIISETLTLVEDKRYRMNLRGIADRTKGNQGNTHTEGDIQFEVTSDSLLRLLYAGRFGIVKTGAGAPFSYAFTSDPVAFPSTATGGNTRKTLS